MYEDPSSSHFESMETQFNSPLFLFLLPSESYHNKYLSHLRPQIWRNIANSSWQIPKQWKIQKDFCWWETMHLEKVMCLQRSDGFNIEMSWLKCFGIQNTALLS